MPVTRRNNVTERRSDPLETWPNPASPTRPYVVRCVVETFTCLCPLSGHPDYGALTITYEPVALIVELKSLKLYLDTFRTRRISHEALADELRTTLADLLAPTWLRVVASFAVRGGIRSTVISEHGTRTV